MSIEPCKVGGDSCAFATVRHSRTARFRCKKFLCLPAYRLTPKPRTPLGEKLATLTAI